MINGAHTVIYTKDAAADRAFFRDVLKLPHVDDGDGWLIFSAPPSEVAFHPGEKNDVHELFFTCEDINQFVAEMLKRDVPCTAPEDHGWGILSQVTLPGGGKLGVYQPRHQQPA